MDEPVVQRQVHLKHQFNGRSTHPNKRAKITLQFFIKVLPKIYKGEKVTMASDGATRTKTDMQCLCSHLNNDKHDNDGKSQTNKSRRTVSELDIAIRTNGTRIHGNTLDSIELRCRFEGSIKEVGKVVVTSNKELPERETYSAASKSCLRTRLLRPSTSFQCPSRPLQLK